MRPLGVEFSAFGPYPETQRLDFEQLPAGTLFLVHGPTGAGKTTILDAICFALYGDTSGKERDGGDMRCQLAPPEILTEVVLDFALGDKRFRVRRVPDQLRPKRRGEGLTAQPKTATLWPLDGAGEPGKPVASGWGKVTRALEELIGLDSAQFRQVVLLPQGQFRKLLTADSRDRELILQRLFDTRRFRDLEDALRAKEAEMGKAAQQLGTEERTVSDNAARVLGAEGASNGLPSRDSLSGARQALSKEIDAAAGRADEAAQAAKKATDALQDGEATGRKLGELKRAREREAALALRRPQVEDWRLELEGAKRALTVEPSKARRERAARALEATRSELDAALVTEKEALAEVEDCARTLDREKGAEAETARDDAARAVTTLLNLRPVVEQLSQARADAEAAGERAREAERGETEARKSVEAKGAERRRAELRRASAARAADGRAELVAALEQAQRHEEATRELEALRKKQAELEASKETARAQLAGAEAELSSLTQSRNDLARAFESGQAARLAATLSSGEPCPVCGSVDHPQPARPPDEHPDESELDAAEAAVDQARERREVGREALARAEEAAAAAERTLRERAEGVPAEESSLDALAASTEKARSELKAAEKAREEEREAGEAVSALSDELDDLQQAAELARGEAEQARQSAAARRGELETREGSVPEELRAAGALGEEIASAEARARELRERWERARQALADAEARQAAARGRRESRESSLQAAAAELKEAERALADALRDAAFDDLVACESAVREPDRRRDLEEKLGAFQREAVESASERQRCEAAAQGLELPDLDALRAADSRADERRRDADGVQARLDERARSADELLAELDSIAERRRRLEERFGVVGRVAQLAVGKNELKLSLHRFVLGALLDEVLDVASVRLASMSGGRYLLRRSEGLGDARRLAGLDLEVEDSYSGRARPVATLSGGESFLAALALALSLAQVVQEHAGGVRLDALFIDEGFGSLDQQALEEAISTLETLGSEGGRLVGVISHVTELAQRIPTRLEVRTNPRGSSARLIAG